MQLKSRNFDKKNQSIGAMKNGVICDLKLAVSLQEGCKKSEKSNNLVRFYCSKKHLFLKNIYSDKDLKKDENSSRLKNYNITFDYFLYYVVLLNKYYNKNSNAFR